MLGLASARAHAALKVFACEPEWAALARSSAATGFRTFSATTAKQDPHCIEARPSLIARLRNADIVVCTGADLEAGWLPALLRSAANPAVQPGARGYFEAAQYVSLLDVPARLDRALGDIHAAGNPHIQTDPRNIARVAAALAQRLGGDRSGAGRRTTRRAIDDFQHPLERGDRALGEKRRTAQDVAVVSQHQGGCPISNAGSACARSRRSNPNPACRTDRRASRRRCWRNCNAHPPKWILRAAYRDDRASEWLAQQAGIRAVVLPFTVGGSEQAADLFGLFDDTVHGLLEAQPMNSDVSIRLILRPALAAGLLVLATHVPLGQEVLAARHRLHRSRGGPGRRPRRDRGLRLRLGPPQGSRCNWRPRARRCWARWC